MACSREAWWPWSRPSRAARWTTRRWSGSSTGTCAKGPTASCPWARPARARPSTWPSTRRSSRSIVKRAAGRIPVIAGAGRQRHGRGHRTGAVLQEGRGRRHPAGLPLLQQAQPGRAVPALCGNRRGGGPAHGPLQHSGADGRDDDARDGRAPGRSAAGRRHQGSHRLDGPDERDPGAVRPDGPLGRRQPDAAADGPRAPRASSASWPTSCRRTSRP